MLITKFWLFKKCFCLPVVNRFLLYAKSIKSKFNQTFRNWKCIDLSSRLSCQRMRHWSTQSNKHQQWSSMRLKNSIKLPRRTYKIDAIFTSNMFHQLYQISEKCIFCKDGTPFLLIFCEKTNIHCDNDTKYDFRIVVFLFSYFLIN